MYGIFVDQRCRGAHKKQEAQRCQNFVVCFKSSSLKPLGQLEPNLAGMCILDCPLERLCFCLLIRDTQNKQEAHRSQKWSCHHCRLSLLLSLSFCILFFFFGTKLVELFIGWSFKKWVFWGGFLLIKGTIFIVEHVPNLESEPSCTVQGLYLAVSINTAKDILCAQRSTKDRKGNFNWHKGPTY